jgi:alginate O-acetyltransferase complex protein AlgI
MLFNSFPFVFFLIITFIVYYIPALRKLQLWILVAASFVFYSYTNPALLLLLLFSISINAYTTYQVYFGKAEKRKLFATTGVVVNLLALSFFKYSPLFSRTFFDPTSSVGAFLLSIPLPIGISFFTFHGISMLVDIYRGKNIEQYGHLIAESPGKHWLVTSLYIAFFPQLIAGPIVKSYSFLPQIKEKYFKDILWGIAFEYLVVGYFFKMVIADNLKDFTFWIGSGHPEYLSSITLITMLFGYSMQIFADFAGYSLIAMGLAELFGYHLPQNFNFPYISRSFSEFWTRWHISLSSWLREYLYIEALGGNRKGEYRTYLNLMIVMVLGGLWHGAAWSYAVWGTFHGVALAIERFITDKVRVKDSIFLKVFQILLVFGFVSLAWLLFKLPHFDMAVDYMKAVFHNWTKGRTDLPMIFFILLYSVPVIIAHLYYLFADKHITLQNRAWKPVLYGVLVFFIIVNSGSSGDFIYFQF